MPPTLSEDRSIWTDYYQHRSYLSPSVCPPRATLPGIPRELRDVIYEHLTYTRANTTGNPLNLEALPSGTRKYAHGAHALLRTNRKLRAEVQEHIRQFETYCVSQRYRAFAGLKNMYPWKHVPIPTSARRLYLRIYIAIPTKLARKITRASLSASMAIDDEASLQGSAADNGPVDEFAVLKAVLRDCCYLEDLVVKLVVRSQGSLFGRGLESLEFDRDTQAVAELGAAAMAREIQRLPRLRRYATVVDRETTFVRREIGQEWTRQCLIPSCVLVCHCYGAYGSTCVEDSRELLAGLAPCAADEWIGFRPDGDLGLGTSA